METTMNFKKQNKTKPKTPQKASAKEQTKEKTEYQNLKTKQPNQDTQEGQREINKEV